MNVACRIPLKEAALGRWKSILPQLGLPAKLLNGKHGPCPICGGTDRFRFDDKGGRGTFFCSVCGPGDGIEFVKRLHGVDFKRVAELVEPLIGLAPVHHAKAGPTAADYHRMRRQVWDGARVVEPGDPVDLWLRARVGLTSPPACLRYHPNLEHRDADGRRTRHPAMLAIVRGADGKPVNIHRTYLTENGQKAAVGPQRMMMAGCVPEGSAIRLSESAECLGVAEGIETALAASAMVGLPVWSTINAAMLRKWLPPAGVTRVVIFGDNDLAFAGQAAAYALARSLRGRRIADVEVRIPDQVGADWNDVLLQHRSQA